VLVYAIAVVAALAIPLLTRGSYSRLINVRWRWGAVLFAGLAIQIALEYVTIPRDHWHDIGFGLLVASYALILIFVARNLVVRGMGIVFIGIACNALVITLNQGMPFKVPAEWQGKPWTEATVKHHPQESDDRFVFLSDIIVLNGPFGAVISFGDLILAVGLCDVSYNASRKFKGRGAEPSRKRHRGSRRGSTEVSAETRRVIDLTEPDPIVDEFEIPVESRPIQRRPNALQDQDPRQDDVLTRSRSTRSRATTTRSS